MTRQAWTRARIAAVLGNIAITAIVAVDAYFLWPTQLGGATSIVVVSGISMEPEYRTGDLVIARVMEPSQGDVVVYSTDQGARIMHRIVGGDESGWITRGDNNAYEDPFSPTSDDIEGVAVIAYPSVGRASALLLSPVVWAAVLLGALVFGLRWRLPRRHRPATAASSVAPDDAAGALGGEQGVDLGERLGTKEAP